MLCRLSAIGTLLVAMIFVGNIQPVNAQTAPEGARTYEQFQQQVNENVVSIISGNPNGSFLYQAYDISAAISKGDDLRILPVVGRGGAHNIRDILYLRGIDMGITQSNTLTYYDKNGKLGPNIRNRISYITQLFVDEMHVLVRPGINSLNDLNGKRVNFSNKGSGTQLTIKLVFEALGIKAQEFNMGQTDAFEKMKTGELDATICVCGRPLRSFRGVGKENNFRLLSVPYSQPLENDYTPTVLSHEDYPNLIPKGQLVETIGISTVLATYNWPKDHPRYARVKKFVDAFFENFEKLKQPPRLKKWKSVNLAAKLKNWQRFPAASEWLQKNQKRLTVSAEPVSSGVDENLLRKQVEQAAPGDTERQKLMFQQFMRWKQQQDGR